MTSALSQTLGRLEHIHGFDDYYLAKQRGVLGVDLPDTLCRLPLPRRVLESAWMVADCPPIDIWADKPDWIYCPAEYFVKTRESRLAVTIHCDNWFNDQLPWYYDTDTVITRSRRYRLYSKIAQKADLIFCVSNFLRERIAYSFGVPINKMVVIGNGVEDEFFRPSAISSSLLPIINQRPYIVIIGGLSRRKGGAPTLKIMRDMAEVMPDLLFVIVGSSEPRYADFMSSMSNIFQAGYVSVNDGLTGLVAGAVGLLFLSRYETFGIPALEAMAAGTIPIVSEHGALPELVGDVGYIVEDSQINDIPDLLVDLASKTVNHARKEALVMRASSFSWDVCTAKVLQAITSS